MSNSEEYESANAVKLANLVSRFMVDVVVKFVGLVITVTCLSVVISVLITERGLNVLNFNEFAAAGNVFIDVADGIVVVVVEYNGNDVIINGVIVDGNDGVVE